MTSTEFALDAEFVQSPHTSYAWMRAEAPVQRARTADGLPVYLVTRYADVRFVLSDQRFGKDYRRTREIIQESRAVHGHRIPMSEDVAAHLLNLDPPDHTRLRRLVTKAFTLRRVERLRPWVEDLTGRLLDDMAGRPEVNMLDALAFPLPIMVISELLGVDHEDRDQFRQWTNVALSGSNSDERVAASEEMGAYLKRLVARKREVPADDLLTGLIEASEEEDRLSEPELIAMVFLLLIAGHETTVNLIGNGVLALLTNPDQFAAVKADPDLVDNAVEEILRFESPINTATIRHTTEAVQVGETEIPEGQIVLAALGSANRDDERFDGGERFDVRRDPSGHLAFGHGIHFCLGASLARMEGQIALRRLVERFPDMELAIPAEELRWRVSTLIHGLESLPVRLG